MKHYFSVVSTRPEVWESFHRDSTFLSTYRHCPTFGSHQF